MNREPSWIEKTSAREIDETRERLAALLRTFWHAPDRYDLHEMVADSWETPKEGEFLLGDLRLLLHVIDAHPATDREQVAGKAA